MLPEKTNYVTNGVDGAKRLAQGPELSSYRGLSIIHSRKFSMDTGTTPRDLLRRRVRVAEYYRIPWNPNNRTRSYEFYDQSRDTMFRLTWDQLCQMAQLPAGAGMDGNDQDYEGHDGDYWEIRPGQEPPTDFTYHNWDGNEDLGAGRLRMVPINPDDNNAVATLAGGYRFEGLDTILQALGLPVTLDKEVSSLRWPRTIYNKEGSKHKKRKLAQLAHKMPVETKNDKSTTFIMNQTPNEQKYHHRQSETWSGGLFNDPLVITAAHNGVLCNWQGITDQNGHTADAYFAYKTVQYFKQLHASMNLSVIETQLQDGLPVPCCANETTNFELECAIQTADTSNRMGLIADFWTRRAMDPNILAEARNGCAQVLLENTIETLQRYHTVVAVNPAIGNPAAAEIAAKVDFLQDMLTPPRAGVQVRGNLNEAATAASEAMFTYIKLLFTWRRQCFSKAVRTMLQNQQQQLPRDGNHGGHSHFATLKMALWTACIAATQHRAVGNAGNLFAAPNNDRETFFAACESNTEDIRIAANIVNKNQNIIKQPNLHINRCTPLKSSDSVESASSLEPTTWILQHMASMMPLTGEMAEALLKPAPGPPQATLMEEYRAFLEGNNNRAAPAGDHVNDYNSFLMHWFMSEFHPKPAVRAVARTKSGNMQTFEFHRVQDFITSMAKAINDNTTYTDELKTTCVNLVPTEYDAQTVRSFYSVAPAAKTYTCISKWAPDEHLHCKATKWYDTPVGSNSDLLYDNQHNTGIQQIEDMVNGIEKTIVKAAPRYKLGVLRTFRPEEVNKPDGGQQGDVAYFNIVKRKDDTVKATDHQVELSNPWTNIIPGGIEAISSLSFPIDLQYRDAESDPKQAAGRVYDNEDHHLRQMASSTVNYCNVHTAEAMRHVLVILFSRFFKPAARFMANGAGIPMQVGNIGNNYAFAGCHLKHGPYLAEIDDTGPGGSSSGAQDIVILRPNIEHEMLGIIMGRGGTQELGATFWGQVWMDFTVNYSQTHAMVITD